MSNKAKQTSIAAFFGGGGAKPAPAQAQGEGATGKRKLDAETAAPPVKKENVAEGDVAAIFKKVKTSFLDRTGHDLRITAST